MAVVDDLWFEHAQLAEVMGVPVLLAPPEEIIWSKAYVCERERYDGNDISHLLRACGERMNWQRLLARFAGHWEVLLSHLLMYRFAFPCDRSQVPDWVMRELLRRTLGGDGGGRLGAAASAAGPLVSKVQYQHVLEHLGYEDGRALRERGGGGGRRRRWRDRFAWQPWVISIAERNSTAASASSCGR